MTLFSRFHYGRSEKGETVASLALIFPILILIIFEIIEVSFVLWGRATVHYILPKAARYVYLNPTSTSAQIQNYATSLVPVQGIGSFSFTATTSSTSFTLQGTFSYTYVFFSSTPSNFSVTLTQSLPV